MKLKFIFCRLSLCCFLLASTLSANSSVLSSSKDLSLAGNDIPWEIPLGSDKGSRSVTPAIPISAFLVDGNLIELDFYEPVGEIEITISQGETSIYSSSENVQSPSLKSIQLSSGLSGRFLLEIRGANGAYAYAWFEL